MLIKWGDYESVVFKREVIISLVGFLLWNIIRGKESVTSTREIIEVSHCCEGVVYTKIRRVFAQLSPSESEIPLEDMELTLQDAQTTMAQKGRSPNVVAEGIYIIALP